MSESEYCYRCGGDLHETCPPPINLLDRLVRAWQNYYLDSEWLPNMGGNPLPLATRQGLALRAVTMIHNEEMAMLQVLQISQADRWRL